MFVSTEHMRQRIVFSQSVLFKLNFNRLESQTVSFTSHVVTREQFSRFRASILFYISVFLRFFTRIFNLSTQMRPMFRHRTTYTDWYRTSFFQFRLRFRLKMGRLACLPYVSGDSSFVTFR